MTLTFQEGASSKFYSLTLDDKLLTVRYGRIGSAGQENLTQFKTAADAKRRYDALLAEKLKKGYVASAAGAPSSGAPSSGAPSSGAPSSGAPAKAPAARKAAAGKPAAALAEGAPEPPLPAPALDDPPAPGLDLTEHRSGPLPAPEPDATPFETGDFVIGGYTLSFGDDEEVIITDARGKRLRSVPERLRKDEAYQSLMRGRKDDRARERRARRVLEERMISGAPVSADEIAWLVEDDAFAPLLRGLLVAPAEGGGPSAGAGVLVAWDKERGLGLLPLDYDAQWIGFRDVELVHPMKLGDVTAWQDLLLDVGLHQALPQVFREVKTAPASQQSLTESAMLSGRETRSAAVIERALSEDGWTTRRGMARRKLSLRAAEAVLAVEAWFDYGECYMPSDPTTTGAFGFSTPGARRPLKLSEVPGVLLSETIRSLEVALAQAGATKDGGGDGEDGEDADSDADSDADDATDDDEE